MTETMILSKNAKFSIGQIVRHKYLPFRGVIVDVDAEFANSEEWWEAIPSKYRPSKEQPFYHLLAENSNESYEAYVSQQNLVADTSGDPVEHPDIDEFFDEFRGDHYAKSYIMAN